MRSSDVHSGKRAGVLPEAVCHEVRHRRDVAVEACRRAGELLMRYHGTLHTFERKGAVDLVTLADKQSEALILEALQAEFPGDTVVTEETGEHRRDGEYLWCLDPLDGTTNFVHGHPAFAVSLGLARAGEWVAGIIVLPYFGQVYQAIRGEGAWGPTGRLRVSETPDVRDSLIATGFPYRRGEVVEVLLEDWRRLTGQCHGVRCGGAAAVDLVFVATGRYDGYFERELAPWDTAAGAVLVEEAGGRISNFRGGVFDPFDGNFLSSNGRVHEELLDVLFCGRKE